MNVPVNLDDLAFDILQLVDQELGWDLVLVSIKHDITNASVIVKAEMLNGNPVTIVTTFVIVFDGEQWTAFADRKASCSVIDDLDNQHGWAASDLAPARSLPLMR